MTPHNSAQSVDCADEAWMEVRSTLPMSVLAVMSDYAVFTRMQAELFLTHLSTNAEAGRALGLVPEDLQAARLCLVPQLTAPIHFGCCLIPKDPGGPPMIHRPDRADKRQRKEAWDA